MLVAVMYVHLKLKSAWLPRWLRNPSHIRIHRKNCETVSHFACLCHCLLPECQSEMKRNVYMSTASNDPFHLHTISMCTLCLLPLLSKRQKLAHCFIRWHENVTWNQNSILISAHCVRQGNGRENFRISSLFQRGKRWENEETIQRHIEFSMW